MHRIVTCDPDGNLEFHEPRQPKQPEYTPLHKGKINWDAMKKEMNELSHKMGQNITYR